MDPYVHPSSVVDEGVSIGEGTRVWHFCHLCQGARIGRGVVLGQNVYVGPGVSVGNGCKVQNNVSLVAGVTLQEDVFIGPSAVFTNVLRPRAAHDQSDAFVPTLVERGASIGANATILCGRRLGSHCMVGAGSVVTEDVPAHALVVGNPARVVGWVDEMGHPLSRPPADQEGRSGGTPSSV